MKKLVAFIFTFVCLSILTQSIMAVAATQYRRIELDAAYALDINDNGQVVGTTGKQAFCWQNGVMTYLQSEYGSYTSAYGINNKGQIVGGINSDYACVWQDNARSTLSSGYAYDINESGQIVGLSGRLLNYSNACIWKDGKTRTLLGVNGLRSIALHINNIGQVIGFTNISDVTTGFLWYDNQTTYYSNTYLSSINDSGVMVGQSRTTGRAIVLQDGTVSELATPSGLTSFTYDINEKGQIVGGYYVSDTDKHACLWDNGQFIDLGDSTEDSSQAIAINENGWIAGISYDANKKAHAVLWVPVPEPSSIIALLCGIGGVVGAVRKRRSA